MRQRLRPDNWLHGLLPAGLAGKLRRLLLTLLAGMLLNALVLLGSLNYVRQVNEGLSLLEDFSMVLAQFDAAQLRLQRSHERADALRARQQLQAVKTLATRLPPAGLEGAAPVLDALEHEFEAYVLDQEQSAALDSSMHRLLDALLVQLQDVGEVADHSPLANARLRLVQAMLQLKIMHQEFALQSRAGDEARLDEKVGAGREAARHLRAIAPTVEGQLAAFNMGQQILQFERACSRQIAYAQRLRARAAVLEEKASQLTASLGSTLEAQREAISRQIMLVVSSSLLISALILALAWWLGRRFVRSITRPLARLMEATEAFAQGHSMPLEAIASNDEIEALAHSFNFMQARVEGQIRVISESSQALRERSIELEDARRETEALNLSLEEKVAQRTAELDAAYTRLAEEHHKLGAMYQQLEQTQGQLLHSEKMASVGQLAAGVAHEINNPVGFVRSNLNALDEYVQDMLRVVDCAAESAAVRSLAAEVNLDFLRHDVKLLLAETREGVERVRAIVASLREYSHPGEPNWQHSDLLAGLESTVRMVWHEIRLKAELRRELLVLPQVRCIPAQINQVFMNLLMNALQAIPERGWICLRSGQEGEMAWVEIEDSGVGMSEEVQRRMCEPFYTTKPVGQGTGLGMSIAYEVIKRHCGSLTVRSTPGEGACVRISLPLAGPEAESVDEWAACAQAD